jgi:hypothetical protein
MAVPAPPPKPPTADVIEAVLIKGDLSKLNEGERIVYYKKMCESAGLNPLTQPFAYITLSGRLTLYALRGATDQLRAIHNVSVEALDESERDGVFVVTAKVRNGNGRSDMAKGAVNIANLKGEPLANALMKAETKAKRRATLSLCGLAILDETEVEDIPAHVKAPPGVQALNPYRPENGGTTPRMAPPPPPPPPVDEVGPHRVGGKNADEWVQNYIRAIGKATTETELRAWKDANSDALAKLEKNYPNIYDRLRLAVETKLSEVSPPTAKGDRFYREAPLEAAPEPVSDEEFLQPLAAKDFDTAINMIANRLASITSQEEMEAWWNTNVAPTEEKWFPPDWGVLIKEFERNEVRIAAQEAK